MSTQLSMQTLLWPISTFLLQLTEWVSTLGTLMMPAEDRDGSSSLPLSEVDKTTHESDDVGSFNTLAMNNLMLVYLSLYFI
jgi:hypothetical protein